MLPALYGLFQYDWVTISAFKKLITLITFYGQPNAMLPTFDLVTPQAM